MTAAASSATVRLATPADAAPIADIYAPFVRDTAVSFEETPPDAATMAQRIAETLSRFPWLVAERDGALLGYAYAGPHRARAAYRWCVETSVYVAPAARRTGLARALYADLLMRLRDRGFVHAYAGITLPNDASVRLHESIGFVPVGIYPRIGWKLGQWHDVGWWRLELGATDGAPREVR